MPSDQAVAREARLVRNLANWLRSQGKQCTVAGWPDRDPGPWPAGLTVEAVLAVGPDGAQEQWAVDVMTVPVPASTAAGMAEARQQLQCQPRSLPRARTGPSRSASASLPGTAPGVKPITRRCSPALRKPFALEATITTRAARIRQPRCCFQTGSSSLTRQDLTAQCACTWPRLPEAAPDLLAELQSTLVAPLDKKLGNQLKRAKDHGYHTLLLLDQVGNESMPAGTTWLPSASAVGTTVAQRVAAYPGVLDAAVLAQPGDSLVQVFGNSI